LGEHGEAELQVTKGKKIALLVASIHMVFCLIIVLSGVYTLWRMSRPYPVTRKDAVAFKEGNIVEVKYEYAYNAYFESGRAFGTQSFVVLKLWGEEEYIYAETDDSSNGFWKDKNYLNSPEKLKAFSTDTPLYFVGKVGKMEKDWPEYLVRRMNRPKDDEFSVPNLPENTNTEYYVSFLNPYWIRDTLLIKLMFTGVSAIVWGILFYRYMQEKKTIEGLQRLKRLEQKKKQCLAAMNDKSLYEEE